MPLRKKSLSQKAVENSQVTKGTSKNQEVLKKGIPNDHSVKHLASAPIVGMSVGSTINMDNYESLRVDVWLTDYVGEGETIDKAYARVENIINRTIGELVDKYTNS